MSRDVAEPRQLASLDGGKEGFMGANQALYFAPYVVVGIMFYIRDAEQLPQALHFECLDSLFCFCQ